MLVVASLQEKLNGTEKGARDEVSWKRWKEVEGG